MGAAPGAYPLFNHVPQSGGLGLTSAGAYVFSPNVYQLTRFLSSGRLNLHPLWFAPSRIQVCCYRLADDFPILCQEADIL